jgi:hypothetical protein
MLLGSSVAAVASDARALTIHSGPASDYVHTRLCPMLAQQLSAGLGHPAECRPSLGGSEVIARLTVQPSDLGYVPLDRLMRLPPSPNETSSVTVLRHDDHVVCLFAVSRNRSVTTAQELARHAGKLRFIVPPRGTDGAATFRDLVEARTSGFDRAREVRETASIDDVVREALGADDTVGFFVDVPALDNPRLKLVETLGGHLVPVHVDAGSVAPDGREVPYRRTETRLTSGGWVGNRQPFETACMPLVLAGGRVESAEAERFFDRVAGLPAENLRPAGPMLVRALDGSKRLLGAGVGWLDDWTRGARERARPWTERAKDAGARAKAGTRETLDAARDAAKELLERRVEKPRE